MRLIFLAHSIQILSSQEFLYDKNNQYENKIKTTINNDDDNNELKAIEKLVEKITKHQT